MQTPNAHTQHEANETAHVFASSAASPVFGHQIDDNDDHQATTTTKWWYVFRFGAAAIPIGSRPTGGTAYTAVYTAAAQLVHK